MREKMNQHLLQLEISPEEYQALPPLQATYWQSMPDYVIARCPLCGATYHSRLDTYSLAYWPRPAYGNEIFKPSVQEIDCSHFVVVHHFLNLNGVIPIELDYKMLGCEVPYVIPVFLPDDVESYAVMHALPICRIEDGQFVPRYSAYLITYCSESPDILMERRWQISSSESVLVSRGLRTRNSWDLARWVQAGKLQWLDAESPDLPLRTGPAEAFPYANVQGHREYTNIYRHGQWEDQSFFAHLRRLIRKRWA
jgi:hypothetical protein